ncbi:MAG: hypothetical protein ABJA87_07170 [bacterium]
MSTATAAPPAAATPSRPGAGGYARIRAVAVAVMGVALIVRSWLLLQSWFVGDDLVFIGRANRMPAGNRRYYFDDYNSHVMPGAFVLVRVLNAWFPWNFVPVALVCVAMIAGVFWLFYRLLLRLFGPTPAILVPLAVFCFSPITVPAFLWWAAALNQLPQHLALLGALLAQVTYLQTGRLRYAVGGVLAVVAGLAFSEKTLLAVPLIFGLTVVFFASGPLRTRLRHVVGRYRTVWSLYLLMAASYAAYYLLAVPGPASTGGRTGDLVSVAWQQMGHAVLPGLLGGPWQWLQISANGAVADPPLALRWVSLVPVVAFVAWSIVRSRTAIGAWLLAAGYVAVDIVLLAKSDRAQLVGSLIGSEMRYSTDLCLVVVLCATLAVVPLRPAERADVQTLTVTPFYKQRGALVRAQLTQVAPSLTPRAVTVAATLAIVAGSVFSTVRFERIWAPEVGRNYVHTARAELAKAGRPLALADVSVPEAVVWNLVYPYNKISYFLHGAKPRPTFLTAGVSSDQLYLPDDSGHLRAAAVVGANAEKGPMSQCGWMVRSAPVAIPLTAPTPQSTWTVRIGYISSRDATTTITVGSTTITAGLQRGLHALYFIADGAVSDVRIDGMPADETLCTDEIAVGGPLPIPGTTP